MIAMVGVQEPLFGGQESFVVMVRFATFVVNTISPLARAPECIRSASARGVRLVCLTTRTRRARSLAP